MPQTPFEDWRDKLSNWSRSFLSKYDTPIKKNSSGPKPLAKDLGWADQTEMRKLTPEGPKLGQKKTQQKKPATKQAARKR